MDLVSEEPHRVTQEMSESKTELKGMRHELTFGKKKQKKNKLNVNGVTVLLTHN